MCRPERSPLRELFALEKSVGHSLKIWAPFKKLFAPPPLSVPSWLRACICLAVNTEPFNLKFDPTP